MTLGERILNYRKRAGLSQERLAEEAAPEKREPRWYLLGILPLAVGAYLLIRGVLQLSAVSGLCEFMKLPGFLS